MSDDQDMIDMTQSGSTTQSGSMALTSLSNCESDNLAWGKMIIYKLKPKRLGIRGPLNAYPKEIIQSIGKHGFLCKTY